MKFLKMNQNKKKYDLPILILNLTIFILKKKIKNLNKLPSDKNNLLKSIKYEGNI